MEISWPDPPTKPIKLQFDHEACWWCGSKGNSREHRIKRTDVIREFGPNIDRDHLFINQARIETQHRGLNASMMKFRKPLCAHCNNARSQPFDQAEVAF